MPEKKQTNKEMWALLSIILASLYICTCDRQP